METQINPLTELQFGKPKRLVQADFFTFLVDFSHCKNFPNTSAINPVISVKEE